MNIRVSRISLTILLYSVFILGIAGCGGPKGSTKEGIDPASLKPGLSVIYFDNKYRFVKEMPSGDNVQSRGRVGNPVLQLNHQFGDGEVYDSGRIQKVGVQMDGFINLERRGEYTFQALSNDGVEIHIGDKRVVSDPRVHGDRLSEAEKMTIDRPGWYPVLVRYFQRKGTAAPKFYWQAPGREDFEIIPASAYGHK